MSARKEIARRALEDAWSGGDLSVFEEHFGPDYVGHTPFGDLRGPEPVKGIITQFRGGMTGITLTVKGQWEEGDTVVSRWKLRATHTGELLGVPATGREFTVHGALILRFEGDSPTEGWQLWDRLTALEQLGAAPVPTAVPAS